LDAVRTQKHWAMTLDTVFLVEDHTKNIRSENAYWARAYVSIEKAQRGVEFWAERGSRGKVRWDESGGACIAYVGDEGEHYTIVPLRVHADDQPEEA